MTVELLKALLIILRFCYQQDNCKKCPLRDLCAKMPCDW